MLKGCGHTIEAIPARPGWFLVRGVNGQPLFKVEAATREVEALTRHHGIDILAIMSLDTLLGQLACKSKTSGV